MRNQTHYNSAETYKGLVSSTRYMEIAELLHVTCLTTEQKNAVDAILRTGATDNRVIVSKM